jgi:uroporphyrinogen decarboxylase
MTRETGPAQMTRRERVLAALRGEPTDRSPISFWQHFPGQDGTPEALVESTLAYQRRFDLDLIKLMPTGMYPVLDYGVQVRLVDDDIGTTRWVAGPVREPNDWRRLPAVSPARGVLAQQVEVVRRVRAALGPDTPVVQTIFSPLTMAAKIVGELPVDIYEQEELLRAALERMADDVIAFGRACLEAGADGFFFATQHANRAAQPPDLHERLGVPYDLKILDALRAGAVCTILHLHGPEPLFHLADRYPVDAVNWHDRETEPSLAQALSRIGKALVAGIARGGAVATGSPVGAAAEVRDAIQQTGGRRLIVAPGCVVLLSSPEANLLAARRAV